MEKKRNVRQFRSYSERVMETNRGKATWNELRTNNVVVAGPQVDVYRVEDTEERKTPGDTVNDDAFAFGEELVDDGAEEEQVDQ